MATLVDAGSQPMQKSEQLDLQFVGHELSQISEGSLPGHCGCNTDDALDAAATGEDHTTATEQEQTWAVHICTHRAKDRPEKEETAMKSSLKFPTNSLYTARLGVAELSHRFPQLARPKLYCFTSVLSAVGSEATKIIQDMEVKPIKRTKRQKVMKKVRRMYSLSHSNEASTRRIMNRCAANRLTTDLCESDVSRLFGGDMLPSQRHTMTQLSAAGSQSDSVDDLDSTAQTDRIVSSRPSYTDMQSYGPITWTTLPLLQTNIRPYQRNTAAATAAAAAVAAAAGGDDDASDEDGNIKSPTLISLPPIDTGNSRSTTVNTCQKTRKDKSSMWMNYT